MKRILIAYDGDEPARRALERGADQSGRGLPAGDPGETIETVAQAGDFDKIVVGSRDLGPVGRFIQGSVSEHLATNAKATVVIAR